MKPTLTLQSPSSSKKISFKKTSDDKVRRGEENNTDKNKYLTNKTVKYFKENKFLFSDEKSKSETPRSLFASDLDCSYFSQYDICEEINAGTEVCAIGVKSEAGRKYSEQAYNYYLPEIKADNLCKNVSTDNEDITSYSTNIYLPGIVYPVTFSIAGQFNTTEFSKDNWSDVLNHIPSYPTTTTTTTTTAPTTTTPTTTTTPIPTNGTIPNPNFFSPTGFGLTITAIVSLGLITIIYCNRKTILNCRKSNEDILKENILDSHNSINELQVRIDEKNTKNNAQLTTSLLHSDETKNIKKIETKIESLIKTALKKGLKKNLIAENTAILFEKYNSVCKDISDSSKNVTHWNSLIH